ncbi:UNVERIFIED_CONTAM: hypothetical protein Slati_1658400 [Sesamum latifolium]|uniref:Uncharacterized protein n=1 Tax=Sesamum latifolium TaxID=2727402 RepID=A0AAW2XGP3_9LAMI
MHIADLALNVGGFGRGFVALGARGCIVHVEWFATVQWGRGCEYPCVSAMVVVAYPIAEPMALVVSNAPALL